MFFIKPQWIEYGMRKRWGRDGGEGRVKVEKIILRKKKESNSNNSTRPMVFFTFPMWSTVKTTAG